MKLILSLALSWMLSCTAEALKCHTGYSGVKPVLQSCDSADELCATFTAQVNSPVKPTYNSTKWSCVPPSVCNMQGQIMSFSKVYVTVTASVHCCNKDRCNDKELPSSYPVPDRKKNGLKCLSCTDIKGVNPQSAGCKRTVECVGAEDRCSAVFVRNKNYVQRFYGCVSANVCGIFPDVKNGSALIDGGNFIDAPTCCGTSFCNSARTVTLSAFPLLLGLTALIVTSC